MTDRDLATLALHADGGDAAVSDAAPPLHVATTFRAGDPAGFVYSREDQPTRRRLEQVLGALEGGHAVTYASGQAATAAALRHARPRRVAVARGGYHGTRALLDSLAQDGVELMPLDSAVAAGDLVWLETPKNPTCELEDIARHARRCREAGALLAVDSTFATPVLQRPLALGAHVVMHSTTKFLSGHSDAMGGVLVVAEAEEAKRLRDDRTVHGAVPGALETWLTLRSIRTLAVRVERQSATATRLASWLDGRVARVWHPSLPADPGHELGRRQMRMAPGILSFELASEAEARDFPSRLDLIRDATSLGGVESLIEWRRKVDAHAAPGLLRLSVGLEGFEDLATDLDRALGR